METIIDYVRRRLMELPRAEWEPLGLRLSGVKTAPRKMAYERFIPSISKVEPYYRYFLERDFSITRLPHEPKPAASKRRA